MQKTIAISRRFAVLGSFVDLWCDLLLLRPTRGENGEGNRFAPTMVGGLAVIGRSVSWRYSRGWAGLLPLSRCAYSEPCSECYMPARGINVCCFVFI